MWEKLCTLVSNVYLTAGTEFVTKDGGYREIPDEVFRQAESLYNNIQRITVVGPCPAGKEV